MSRMIYEDMEVETFEAIASMMRSQEADPTNLEVLLALGVSHTNGIIASDKYKCSEEIITIAAMLSIGASIFCNPIVNENNARFHQGDDGGDHIALLEVSTVFRRNQTSLLVGALRMRLRNKARLFANGNSKKTGVNYHETFNQVDKPSTICTVLCLATFGHWHVRCRECFYTWFLSALEPQYVYGTMDNGLRIYSSSTSSLVSYSDAD
ncbi:hypothetical protein Tco_1049613 [Tanacetum coccineum]